MGLGEGDGPAVGPGDAGVVGAELGLGLGLEFEDAVAAGLGVVVGGKVDDGAVHDTTNRATTATREETRISTL